jgi:S-methylmethionine-dependent homocysteine/selenocysteine methylase
MASIISKEQERNTKSRGWLIEWFEDHSKGECSSLLLLDGGVSTYLENIAAFSHRSLWSSSLLLRTTPINDSSTVNAGHEAIRACHEAFFQAGSDIVSTVTYQCHYNCCGELLFQRGDVNGEIRAITGNDIDQMLRDGIRLAREARCNVLRDSVTSRDLFVAASVGCYGASLADGSEYRGMFFCNLAEKHAIGYFYSFWLFQICLTNVLSSFNRLDHSVVKKETTDYQRNN